MDLEAMRRTPGEFRVLEYEVPDFVGDCTGCDYGDPDAAHLRELRQEFALDAVVAGIDREWEQLLALKRWVRSRWDHGWSRSGADHCRPLRLTTRCTAITSRARSQYSSSPKNQPWRSKTGMP